MGNTFYFSVVLVLTVPMSIFYLKKHHVVSLRILKTFSRIRQKNWPVCSPGGVSSSRLLQLPGASLLSDPKNFINLLIDLIPTLRNGIIVSWPLIGHIVNHVQLEMFCQLEQFLRHNLYISILLTSEKYNSCFIIKL